MASASLRAPWLVPRPFLRTALEQVRGGEVLMTVAPIGYGKSTLFRLWEASSHVRSVTFPVEDRHRDLTEFATDLSRALASHLPAPIPILEGVPDNAWFDQVIALLGTAPLLLMIDDVHQLSTSSLALLKRLVLHTPPTLMLGISSRSYPNIGLTRAHREGRLRLMNPKELLLKPAELGALRRSGFTDQDLTDIYRETGGWPLALGVILASRLGPKPNDGPQALTYLLSEEIFPSIADDELLFLAQVAAIAPADSALLDAARVASDSSGYVRHFSRNPFPLVRATQAGITIQPVMREALVNELRVRAPGVDVEVRQRSAEHLLARGKPTRAFTLLEASGDRAALAKFAYEVGRSLALAGEVATVRKWIHEFQPAELETFGELSVLCAIVEGAEGNFMAMAQWLLSLEGRDAGPVIHNELGVVSPAELLGEVLGSLPEGEATAWVINHQSWWSVVAWLTRAFGHLGAGELAKAEGVLVAMGPFAQPLTLLEMWRQVCLAYICALRDDYGRGEVHVELARQAAELFADTGRGLANVGYDAVNALYAAAQPERRVEALTSLKLGHERLQFLIGNLPRRTVMVQAMLIEAAIALGKPQLAVDIVRDVGQVDLRGSGNDFHLERIGRLASDIRAAQLLLPEGVDLSAAEIRVLSLLASPASVPLIAKRMGRSPATVRAHARAIYKKLGVHRRSEAVEKAIEFGLAGENATGPIIFDDENMHAW